MHSGRNTLKANPLDRIRYVFQTSLSSHRVQRTQYRLPPYISVPGPSRIPNGLWRIWRIRGDIAIASLQPPDPRPQTPVVVFWMRNCTINLFLHSTSMISIEMTCIFGRYAEDADDVTSCPSCEKLRHKIFINGVIIRTPMITQTKRFMSEKSDVRYGVCRTCFHMSCPDGLRCDCIAFMEAKLLRRERHSTP